MQTSSGLPEKKQMDFLFFLINEDIQYIYVHSNISYRKKRKIEKRHTVVRMPSKYPNWENWVKMG